MFQSLRSYNYRLWAGGALVSNVGTWMQRIGQDWLVLTVLTDHNATAVGMVMALQFGPPLLLLPLTGFAADHWDRRKLLLFTQAAAGLLALGLGVLTLAGLVQLWHVYGFALLLGCVTAFGHRRAREHRAQQCRLTRSGLTDETEGLSLPDFK